MQGNLANVVRQAAIDPAILSQVATNPDIIIEKFGLTGDEAVALRTNNFDSLAGKLGVDRLRRAANHDDAYLS